MQKAHLNQSTRRHHIGKSSSIDVLIANALDSKNFYCGTSSVMKCPYLSPAQRVL